MSGHRKQIGSLVIGQYGSLLLSFVLPLILARVLSVSDYGVYSQFTMISSLAIGALTFGMSSELYYYLPKATPQRRSAAIVQAFGLLVCVALMAAGVLSLPFVRDYINSEGDFTGRYAYLVLFVALSIPEYLTTNLYILNHHNRLSSLYLPSMTLLRVGSILLFYFLHPGVSSILIALTVVAAVRFVVSAIYGLRSALTSAPYHFDGELLRGQLRYTLPLGSSQALRSLSTYLDKVILMSVVTPAQYGIYSIAFYGVPGLMQVYNAVSQTYVARMVEAKTQGKEAVVNVYRSMVSKTLAYCIPVLAAVMGGAPKLVPLVFSAKFAASTGYFQIYLVTFLFLCLGAGNMLRAVGKTRMQLYAFAGSLTLMVPVSIWAINRWTTDAAILCSTISMILPVVILSVMDARIMGCPTWRLFPWGKIWRQFLSGGVGLTLTALLLTVVGDRFTVLLAVGAGCLAGFAVEALLDCFLIPRQEIGMYAGKIGEKIRQKINK